jgi:hypothetical protein
MSRNTLCSGLALSILAFALSAGCNKQIKTYPVSGEIYVDGKPAESATIYLIPSGDMADKMPRPFGQTDKDGKFTLSTFKELDGAPAGEYVAIFQWPEQSGGIFNRSIMDGRDRLGGAYYNKDTSQIHVTIEKQPTNLPRFELKTK